MNTVLDKDTGEKNSFISLIISEFAYVHKMQIQDAYGYLKKYGGLDYLIRHWWTLHAEDLYWLLNVLYSVCYKNGGNLISD